MKEDGGFYDDIMSYFTIGCYFNTQNSREFSRRCSFIISFLFISVFVIWIDLAYSADVKLTSDNQSDAEDHHKTEHIIKSNVKKVQPDLVSNKVILNSTLNATTKNSSKKLINEKYKHLNGVYFMQKSERSALGRIRKFTLNSIVKNNQPELQMLLCDICRPQIYTFDAFLTEKLERNVFKHFTGMMLVAFDELTLVAALPNESMEKAWAGQSFINVYSKQKSFSLTIEQAEQFVETLSKTLSNPKKELLDPEKFYTAIPHKYKKKNYTSVRLIVDEKRSITMQSCDLCKKEVFEYLSEESSVIGKALYKNGTKHYLLESEPNVWLWLQLSIAFGKDIWGPTDAFNVFAVNSDHTKQIKKSAEKQLLIKQKLHRYTSLVQSYFEKKFAESEQ